MVIGHRLEKRSQKKSKKKGKFKLNALMDQKIQINLDLINLLYFLGFEVNIKFINLKNI